MRHRLILATLLIAGPTMAELYSPIWSMRLAATTTSACVLAATGGVCAQFPSGSANKYHSPAVTTDAAVRCCWSMATGLDITDSGLSDASGPNGTAPCGGMALNASAATRDQRPVHSDLSTRGGARLGLCSVSVTSGTGAYYAPCGISAGAIAAGTSNSDCTSYGGGTCVALADTTANQRAFSSVFLICEAAITANVDALIEAVQR